MYIAFLIMALWLPLNSALAVIGDVTATYSLDPENSRAWGLAYRIKGNSKLLYVADYSDDKIYAYVIKDGLEYSASDSIDTNSLHGYFVFPRGLAYGEDGRPYLYAITSYEIYEQYEPRLWRIDLETLETRWIDLNLPAFGISGREVFGLVYFDSSVYISYDTSDHSSPDWQVRHGILKLKVGGDLWWTRASSGNPAAVEKHIPHSGRWIGPSNKYTRAPAFDLACMYLDSTQYLWGTSYHKYIYVADGQTGRGVFFFDSPGERNIYGLAYGDGCLWAVDRISGPDQVHKIKVTDDYQVPTQGPRHVRHLRMRLKDTTWLPVLSPDLKHNFAGIHPQSVRPSQDRDDSSVGIDHNVAATVAVRRYDPAGDTTARQYYHEVKFPASAMMPGDSRWSTCDADFWSSDYRHFVYPHRCNVFQPPPRGYTDDDDTVYRMSDYETYEDFRTRLAADIEAEYGFGGLSNNPFWTARNILEFIKENYSYGNIEEEIVGHYKYNPANFKLRLLLDGDVENDKMSCSPSAFAMIGLCRYQGLPARWIGTTKQRGNWDSDYDRLMTQGEKAIDTSYHRWAEVWMGSDYGWQRFDPTPLNDYEGAPRQLSQFELMQNSACGISSGELVLTAGSGYHEPFYRQKDHCQRYNSVPRYGNPEFWYGRDEDFPDRVVLIEGIWTNACFIDVTAPTGSVSGKSAVVEWLTTGRWDMAPSAAVSVYLQPMRELDTEFIPWGSPYIMASGVPYDTGSLNVDISDFGNGWYRFMVIKDGDQQTGGQGTPFSVSRTDQDIPFSDRDLNRDGIIDILDLIIVARYFGEASPGNPKADINRDGTVDGLDLALIGQYFGETQ